ncbi:hypothetical protein ACOME3_002521 [Neoechinorhynchus agilis]
MPDVKRLCLCRPAVWVSENQPIFLCQLISGSCEASRKVVQSVLSENYTLEEDFVEALNLWCGYPGSEQRIRCLAPIPIASVGTLLSDETVRIPVSPKLRVLIRALNNVNAPNILEPSNLCRLDSRYRPDGVAIFPWREGKRLL